MLKIAEAEDQWWCECHDSRKPHVHCPWGGMHIHVVDPETGCSIS